MNPNYITGSFTGTGAALTVDGERVGFRPKKVYLLNVSTGTELLWLDSMPNAAGSARATAGDKTLISSGGVTPTASGFSLGDAAVNGSGNAIHFECVG